MILKRGQPKFLLDECTPLIPSDWIAGTCIRSTCILSQGISDHTLFEESKKRNLTIITCDYGFVIRAVIDGRPIIYQDQKGDRYMVHSKFFMKNHFRKRVSDITKYILLNDEVMRP